MRWMATPDAIQTWVVAVLPNRALCLSSACMIATLMDFLDGRLEDSERTMWVKYEGLQLLNAMLRDPAMQYHDAAVMTVLHVMAG